MYGYDGGRGGRFVKCLLDMEVEQHVLMRIWRFDWKILEIWFEDLFCYE